ncbi:hypothetical protein PLANPX_1046 [Lacipirellula parvula]|uniref:Uncharacterized protein n=1 Tax=Lacipirellula parvula TaxID=2650471 RepID=A0A5K7X442_9BACT|nr:hypothetical protein PLANPX_1046 [Lacipirellula parvula]
MSEQFNSIEEAVPAPSGRPLRVSNQGASSGATAVELNA